MKTWQLIEKLRGFKNRLLLRLGYTMYNKQGKNIVFLDKKTNKQWNSSGRTKECRMGDVNWVIHNPTKHWIRPTFDKHVRNAGQQAKEARQLKASKDTL